MKKINFLSIALIGASALLTAACVQEITSNEEMYRPAGSPIVFSAATSYDNGVATRAVYSGEVFGSSTLYQNSDSYERIDWEKNDQIRLYYNTTPGDYKVANNGTASDEISKAELTGGDLQWDGSGNHTFYGLYPSTENSGGTITASGQISGFIPKDQSVTSLKIQNFSETVNGETYTYDKFQPDTRKYGFLVARETVDASSTASGVTLRFKPAFTTFEFKFNRAGSGAVYKKLMSATLATESVDGAPALPLAGNFQIKLSGTDTKGATWNTATTGTNPTVISGSTDYPLSTSITVGFGENGIEIPEGKSYLDFSVLCLPIELKGVKLILTFEGGGQKVLRFKDNDATGKPWYTFAAARKYVITNVTPSSDWVYVIEEILDKEFTGHNAVSNIGFNVKSYKYATDNPSYKVEVPWHIQYSTDGITYGDTGGNSDFQLSGLPDSAHGEGSYTTGEDRATNIIRPNTNYSEQSYEAESISRTILQGTEPVGSSSAPYDLSMYDIHGTAHTQTTANSYVVSAPGWYKFPVVYGNAITNGADNKSAYDPYSAGSPLASHWDWVWNGNDGPEKKNHDVYMTEHFLNALNEPITSPYVLVDVQSYVSHTLDPQAVLIWQDTEVGDEIIGYGTDDLKLVGSGANAYIHFYINPTKIHQGNIVLAVRDGSNEEVLWSWQIWVCEKDLTPITSRNLLPYNLGWIDQSGLKVRNYTDRINYYRIVQDETGGDTEDFYVKQIGDDDAIPNNTGYNPFYQWGRKDPITSATSLRTSQAYATQLAQWGDAANIYQFPNNYPLFDPPTSEDYHSPSYAEGIKRPWIPMHDPDNNGWVNGQFYPPYEQFWHTDFLRGSQRNPYDHAAANPSPYYDPYAAANLGPDHVPHKGNVYRKISGCPFNLWNSYAYGSEDFSGSHKYKTVYDPCPPGFCVPSLGSFAGIESATIERDAGHGVNVIFANGDAFFLPFSGSRGTRQYEGNPPVYIVNDRGTRGVYWVDAPSAVSKSNNWTDVMTGNDWSTISANHGFGWWWYQFAKSLHIYNATGAFTDEVSHGDKYVKYTPEVGHWNATNQRQKVGFDDVRSNAFSIRPVVDPMY